MISPETTWKGQFMLAEQSLPDNCGFWHAFCVRDWRWRRGMPILTRRLIRVGRILQNLMEPEESLRPLKCHSSAHRETVRSAGVSKHGRNRVCVPWCETPAAVRRAPYDR